MLRGWRVTFGWFFALAVAASLFVPLAVAQETDNPPVARAVLFFSPSCGHCEYVIQEVMPSWFETHGGLPWEVLFDETADRPAFFLLTNGTLELLLVDVTVESGFEMFTTATIDLAIGNEAVPRLIIGREVAIGSVDIPERVPAILEGGLAGAGIAWPAVAGVVEVIGSLRVDSAAPVSVPTTLAASPETTTTTPAISLDDVIRDESGWERFGRDPVGNGAAVVVLVGMLASVAALVWPRRHGLVIDRLWIPMLAAAGLAVAGYLTGIESGGGTAVCGPVGDCNAVQQSEYAFIWGVPVGLIGVAGYLAMLAAWLVGERGDARWARRARMALISTAAGGVVFSIYLTFLEPFVIGATCIWCLTSAVIVTLILVIATGAPEPVPELGAVQG